MNAEAIKNITKYSFCVCFLVFLSSCVVSQRSRRHTCAQNIQKLGISAMMYADEYDDDFVIPKQWCDVLLKEEGINPEHFTCPLIPAGTYGYAINRDVFGKNIVRISPGTVMLFEADLGKDGVGGPEDVICRHRRKHAYGCNIVYVNGLVEFVTEDRIKHLDWTAD